MILTGSEIEKEWAQGRITIEPFTPEQVNPNSYNFRLGKTLRVYSGETLSPRTPNEFVEIEIPDDGYVLEPGKLYLAHTIEVLGSDHYAPTFAARSSVARLGMFINLSASLGDIGYKGQWTLQLYTLNRVRVYTGLNIGQMMWWKPQGDVDLYEGKYQGATGPRSSDIHVDYDKQFARQRFPGLGASVSVADVGPKFAALAASSREFSVPPAFCIGAGEFAGALSAEQTAELTDAFADLRATVGAFYTESLERIQSIGAQIRFPQSAHSLLRARLKEIFGDRTDLRFAVRSSGLDEDADASSLAGVHHSVLNVCSFAGIVAAIERCWASYYDAPAVAARLRADNYDVTPRLAVIVQSMVQPVIAGVAFTGLEAADPERVVIEHVEGLADQLVAGVVAPVRTTSDAVAATPDSRLAEVVALARALRDRRGHHVDVEWAADDSGVHLIQVRPLTATIDRPRAAAEPVGQAVPMYVEEVPPTFHLGDVARVYANYVAKRSSAYRLAAANGAGTGAAWVIQFNGRGLHDEATVAGLRDVLRTGAAPECVLDLGDQLRQIVLPKEDVLARLAELAGARASDTELRAVIIRDYLRGELGMISRNSGAGIVVEFTADGLMALNRGTAGGETIVVADLERPFDDPGNLNAAPGAEPLLPHLHTLARLTGAMSAKHGPVTLEWVLSAGEPYFVDYSVRGADELVMSSEGAVLISPGTAHGTLLRLEEDELLSRMSIGPAISIEASTSEAARDGMAMILDKVLSLPERPIIHAALPYAALSVLIGHVAGFVFEKGSTLGHLPILLRESGVPAVAVPGFTADGEVIISDASVVTVQRLP
ncbi:deoxycytidine triphosphate deaminase [Micromonospora orduensis]|uniref:Deoxycytidine triphosphate deaminase n=1 Tax=Micromonospora orduensis TaxID=1420891 RepID=A0A5C4QSB1_9ACTN|nr:PEP/pyruvate-binding domain-containing protein [Micromonospora orduensis]TNH29641.1 deoxycytidine triphosphate deaminase [Micromonospora orduensis]